MSFQALGWLSSKLGINIDGRAPSEECGVQNVLPSSSNVLSGTVSKLDSCFHKMNEVVFSCDNGVSGNSDGVFFGCVDTTNPGGGDCSGKNNSAGLGCEDEVELDENGLPVTKNWYYFDKELNRWNVSPTAPAKIREEYERRLKEELDEREGRNVLPPPPPPQQQQQQQQQQQAAATKTPYFYRGAVCTSHGAGFSSIQTTTTPAACSSLEQRQQQHLPDFQGLPDVQKTTLPVQLGPQYAIPNYIETTTLPTPVSQSHLSTLHDCSNFFFLQQQQHRPPLDNQGQTQYFHQQQQLQ